MQRIPASQATQFPRGSGLAGIWLLTCGFLQAQESGLAQSRDLCLEPLPATFCGSPGVEAGRAQFHKEMHQRTECVSPGCMPRAAALCVNYSSTKIHTQSKVSSTSFSRKSFFGN